MTSIGVDLGATKISGALFNENGESIIRKKTGLTGAHGLEVVRKINSLIEEILHEATQLHHRPGNIGICVPGIAHRSGDVWAPNIKGWEHFPLKKEVEEYFNNTFSVFVDSDRACHIMAEVWKGGAKDCRDAIFLAVGTGIGAGFISNGHVIRGSHDISGAIGWMALKPPYDTYYSERGCFESHASGYGIAQRAKEYIRQGMDSILHSRVDTVTTEDVFDAYEQNDPVALLVIDAAIQLYGMAAANLVSLLNPEKIFFGGGVFGPATKFIDKIYDEAVKWGQPVSMKQVKFEPSKLSGDAGLIGAGYLALENGEV